MLVRALTVDARPEQACWRCGTMRQAGGCQFRTRTVVAVGSSMPSMLVI